MTNPSEFVAVGRRKTSTARVYMRPGSGRVTINRRPLEEYFKMETRRHVLLSPFEVTETSGMYDLVVNVKGGGLTGQSEAIRLGASRALVQADEERRKALREAGYLTRDPRMVERKKYGQPKARKRFQFSKR
ncbi:MAG: 30S ribosomal protein S9 [Bacteroidota bacterium]|nr:30S ribosomal protein S9 [Bacteroidota bacterium]MXW82902.1 30S ribosomal protein S9 [Rhodothermaceae bacterium]MDE2672989.1 30S ribosomal protein S9 [Bacteroidota bacterium]MDE2770554.1 30S ribosomal protein S9 [Bacteroidota bacterium]MXX59077.1 30S ribosomal protein S9 [Rhodothermaceae bacterium]